MKILFSEYAEHGELDKRRMAFVATAGRIVSTSMWGNTFQPNNDGNFEFGFCKRT